MQSSSFGHVILVIFLLLTVACLIGFLVSLINVNLGIAVGLVIFVGELIYALIP